MPRFHNPYHFVPLIHARGPGAISLGQEENGRVPDVFPSHLTHDRFVKSATVDGKEEPVYSGRLVCRLVVCELLAVGGAQTAGNKDTNTPREVTLFRVGDRWAIPGSSLRGLIASIAEAASNSALRVLDDEKYSRSTGSETDRKELGRAFDYFKASHPELVPLHYDDGRKSLSLAEQLFGIVEMVHGKAKTPKAWRAFSLAGRLRFSNALASPEVTETKRETTQILGKPNAPSASLYLHPKQASDGGYIHRLDPQAGTHRPNGRKFYLHRRSLENDDWISRNPADQAHQKARVSPLKGGEFWFHIDFENLSQLELELLCFALTPSDAFHHKLGMGKPLGLGKVKLDPMGLFLIDRHARYADDPVHGSPRHHRIWRKAEAHCWPPEYASLHAAPAGFPGEPAVSPAEFREAYRQRIARGFPFLSPVLAAIALLGDPNGRRIPHPVHYPQPQQRERRKLAGAQPGSQDKSLENVTGAEMERNSYEWFVENDKQDGGGQFLRTVTAKNTGNFAEIPSLERAASTQPPPPPAMVQAAPPNAAAATGWRGPVECVFEKKEIGVGNRLRFRTAEKVGGEFLKGLLATGADLARLPHPLNIGTRVPLRYATVGSEIVFDFPPPQ